MQIEKKKKKKELMLTQIYLLKNKVRAKIQNY